MQEIKEAYWVHPRKESFNSPLCMLVSPCWPPDFRAPSFPQKGSDKRSEQKQLKEKAKGA